ncbi:hypothetical protein S7335_2112 [Synechococcus sp. PCC 7335]|uniref:hypothetical protein n=1 Tax=Synechococcus sp. (strain ATCC 29403 / PCC 7335) TaxID=91464 RepID=UPI00017EB4C4|nr:hypothetical protein [Synechococcus sp. PCC 7335]EDX84415.1 hypothetical protein S7335_2112 [Synechococcus sp. PCC 7335]
MFGTYQQSKVRIEIAATAEQIGQSLTQLENLRRWMKPQQIYGVTMGNLKTPLTVGQSFKSAVGLSSSIKLEFGHIDHQVELIAPNGIRFLLSGGIDGFHEWQWGDGWVQSRIEGISLLPLNLAQTAGLIRLRQHLEATD